MTNIIQYLQSICKAPNKYNSYKKLFAYILAKRLKIYKNSYSLKTNRQCNYRVNKKLDTTTFTLNLSTESIYPKFLNSNNQMLGLFNFKYNRVKVKKLSKLQKTELYFKNFYPFFDFNLKGRYFSIKQFMLNEYKNIRKHGIKIRLLARSLAPILLHKHQSVNT